MINNRIVQWIFVSMDFRVFSFNEVKLLVASIVASAVLSRVYVVRMRLARAALSCSKAVVLLSS